MQAPDLRSEVHVYLTATLCGLECRPLQVGGVADHIHILAGLSRTTCLAELVKMTFQEEFRTLLQKYG